MDVGCHAPPRGVGVPRSFCSAAMRRAMVMDRVGGSSMMGCRLASVA